VPNQDGLGADRWSLLATTSLIVELSLVQAHSRPFLSAVDLHARSKANAYRCDQLL